MPKIISHRVCVYTNDGKDLKLLLGNSVEGLYSLAYMEGSGSYGYVQEFKLVGVTAIRLHVYPHYMHVSWWTWLKYVWRNR